MRVDALPMPGTAGRRRLLWGTSLGVLVAVLGASEARAQSLGALMAASRQAQAVAVAVPMPGPSASTTAASSGMTAASARAARYLTQLNSGVDLAKQAQAAAQAAAKALNQNQRGGVADGLQPGGLQAAVTRATAAASDPTGVATWQGAALPTASASNPNQVTVVQTDPRAVLSWTTFNVGQNTTLTFQQQKNGVAQPGWVALNRVVGQINPATGLRDPGAAPAPSRILGSVKADGAVLVINQNGIMFGPTSQVNVGALIASSLEIGSGFAFNAAAPNSLPLRNARFLEDGLLGFQQQQAASGVSSSSAAFSAQVAAPGVFGLDALEGAVTVETGASLSSADGGYLMLLAPRVVNAGQLSSADGEVALQSGRAVTLTASTGAPGAPAPADPDVRGLVVTSSTSRLSNTQGPPPDDVENTATGLILTPRGYASLGTSATGAATDAGVISSTTSVSANGYVSISGATVTIAPDAVIAVGPDAGATTIPQDPTSLASFKSSRIRIGSPSTGVGSIIDVGTGSLVYAPGGRITVGVDPGASTVVSATAAPTSQVTLESGATIDAAGLTDVVVPASRNSIVIDPVKGNELADAPAFRNGFLNGATVYLDPRISGVTANGVAYTGSPLIAATAYAQQVGVSVSELMVAGGQVTLGVQSAAAGSTLAQAPKVAVAPGATIDVAGGWKTYQAGTVQESYLVTATGGVIPISQADPDAVYVGLYQGYVVQQPRFGVTQTYSNPLLSGARYDGQYTEGQDAGALTLKGSVSVLDGELFAGAYAGTQQVLNAARGTAASSVYGDKRTLQAAPSQLPSGGYLDVQATGVDSGASGGADIAIVAAARYTPGLATTIGLNADALSAAGLSQLTVQTTGKVTVAADATLTLAAGGAFEATAGRTLTVAGAVDAPGGSIDLTTISGTGSVATPEPLTAYDPTRPGPYDIVVSGRLNVAGRWVNDYGAPAGGITGSAYLNGGEITLDAAPRVTLGPTVQSSPRQAAVQPPSDISGSLLIQPGASLDLSGGGYVGPTGALTLTSRGGNLSLIDDTTYFQVVNAAGQAGGGTTGFTVNGIVANGGPTLPLNPGAVTSRVSIADGAIRDAGFAGGGTFTLTTPAFAFGDTAQTPAGQPGATLPLDFFSASGFSTFKITSYGTQIVPSVFQNAFGGYDAILQTQVAEVGGGQTLSLSQSLFSPFLTQAQTSALQTLATGASLYSVFTPAVAADAFDQKPVSLSLGGLMELRVDAGGRVTGAPGAAVSVGQLFNEGVIRVAGGTLTQSEVVPVLYANSAFGVHRLSDVFGGPVNAAGQFSETATALIQPRVGATLTNAQVASNTGDGGSVTAGLTSVYLLADLNVGEGVRLAPGSVTDLSGAAIVNPFATPKGGIATADFVDGRVVAGGSLTSTNAFFTGALFPNTPGAALYAQIGATGEGDADRLIARPGSLIDLRGAQATFDRPVVSASATGTSTTVYAPTLVWSDGGTLALNEGGVITGATILAQGGAPLALGGTLSVLNPVLYAHDPGAPTVDAISADAVAAAGFSTLVAQNSLTSAGDVTLSLPRSLFVQSAYDPTQAVSAVADAYSPVIGSGGALEIDAPYIALDGAFQAVSTPAFGTVAAHSLLLKADAIDVVGAVVLDQSIGQATLAASGDIRLIGAPPSTIGLSGPAPTTLAGQLVANGDIAFASAQVYATTGSSFTVASSGASSPAASNGGTIRFQSNGAAAATPYSAGSRLLVQAANIDQDGVVRAPLGALTLGSNTASAYAPATAAVTLDAGSTTSVSADGLSIPYGITTDQVEYYFTPTNGAPLTAPPAGVLQLAGGAVTTSAGATVDLKGGGDVYAYEFVSGTGGTRDVLNRFNPDPFSSNNGYQYADGRQVYAIVPGLSSAAVAAFDPLYSANYGAIYGPSQAGLSAYFNAAPGLAAGSYTLLPAQYALLPGGMRVVQDTTAASPPAGGSAVLRDGTIVATGYFGVAGVATRSANVSVFDVQSQSVIATESKIALTSGDVAFAADAVKAGVATPQLPIDAGRLVLSPVASLTLDASFLTTPANLAARASAPAETGRGSQVDISGASLIVDDPAAPVAPVAGSIVLTDASLERLGAASLLLGGTRTENADGTTALTVASNSLTVAGGTTLSAPEVILATDGRRASLTVDDGAAIVATGAVTGESSAAYIIDGGVTTGASATRVQDAQGAFLRVSNGPERLLTRLGVLTGSTGFITLGAAQLKGAAIEADSAGGFTLSPSVDIEAGALALSAKTITVGTAVQGLVITPALQAAFGRASSLTLRSPSLITFDSGAYGFSGLTLDAPGLVDGDGGALALNVGGALKLSNSGGPAPATCDGAGAPACGSGTLTLSANQIAFGGGPLAAYGTGGGVTLAATAGVFVDGVGALDVGSAPLTLNTPFLGDRAGAATAAVPRAAAVPGLTLTSAGAVTIASGAPAASFTAPAGSPGTRLTIDGASVTVSGAELRATAGALTIRSATGISVADGAVIATPAYAQTFGDAADPVVVSAPGGALALTARGGDIAVSDDSRLVVGGAQGAAGALSLVAQAGRVFAYHGTPGTAASLASTFSAAAPAGGASLTVDTGGTFDLADFAAGSGQAFTGAVAVRSATGDLTLAAGERLAAASLRLTADGGQIVDAGRIDTSGASGGDVTLYGAAGVHLTSAAVIDAHADGYGATSALQAHGGDVILGVDGGGGLAVDAGATIDVSARSPGARLVPLNRTGGTDYTYVGGDLGGTLTLRAPVIAGPGGETVAVTVQGAVAGARSVALQGFRRFDLNALGGDPAYVGVDLSPGAATLDLAETAAGKINALADTAGPVVSFVQGFDVSADYAALGGLASQADFHARPEVELDYAGDIVLKSNWNLGAGVVNVAGAAAAGLLTPTADLPGRYSIVSGAEGEILARYTTAVYRTGGSFYGEPGVLTLRAGGTLDLKGSITDGFFQFADQTDPDYLNQVLGGGARVYQGALQPAVSGDQVFLAFPNAVNLTGPNVPALLVPYVFPIAPFSADANAPAALGDVATAGGALIADPANPLARTGDPLGSAALFPLLPGPGDGTTAVGSWSYNLVAGAALATPAGQPSANPLATAAGSKAAVVADGRTVYGYRSVAGPVTVADSLQLIDTQGQLYTDADGFQAYRQALLEQDSDLVGSDLQTTTIVLGSAPEAARPAIFGLTSQFFAANPQFARTLMGNKVITSFDAAVQLLAYYSANFAQISPFYKGPTESGINGFSATPVYAAYANLVRTGTGRINVAAAGDIDLTGGPAVQLSNRGGLLVASGSARAPRSARGLQLGGAALYTAGHLADLGAATATDATTGVALAVDLGANAIVNDNLDAQGTYTYGGGSSQIASGLAGVLLANPTYAAGGGAVTLRAGGDVLSRRNTVLEGQLGGVGGLPVSSSRPAVAGSGDQPWRTGSVGAITNLLINPQLFDEGVGTLGGGAVSITAGGSVADVSIVATDSVATANVGGLSGGRQPRALVNFGGGDVSVLAGGDILGARLDVAAGNAALKASGDIASAGALLQQPLTGATADDAVRVRLSAGTVTLKAGGSVSLQGVAALGVEAFGDAGADSAGFYAPGAAVSILADGGVGIANVGYDVVTTSRGTDPRTSAIYPGAFGATSLSGDLGIGSKTASQAFEATETLLYPDSRGTLTLLAGGDIAPMVIAQLDSDPTLLPGAFSLYATSDIGVTGGLAFDFPAVLPNTSDVVRRELHDASIPHAGDPSPDRIVAGRDIDDVILATAKQTRVSAGRDLVNTVFFGQNLAAGDITRITAGRDITATTTLASPVSLNAGGIEVFAAPLPAVQGNTFVLGGPGALFIEAGRDAGPFLNSAVTNGAQPNALTGGNVASGAVTFGGGIVTVGDLWNPALPSQSADIYTAFGVGKGQDYAALVTAYLDPASFAGQPGYLFEQTADANGIVSADRTKEVYALSLTDWLKSAAPDLIGRYDTAAGVSAPAADAPPLIQFLVGVKNGATPTLAEALSYLPQLADQRLPLIPWLQLNQSAALVKAYGSEDVTYEQALAAFQALPALIQRQFLIKDVYFNELIQTSIPSSPSYLKYSRGYQAVNTLFPASYGYTANSLGGGPAGASATVETGDLDLRLATIQTEEGGDISILGPGGRVLAGSTVSTAAQAARRAYIGGQLYTGDAPYAPFASAITQIPSGYEGVLTLRGGFAEAFTDGDFLLNQSRAFTEEGGDVALWSSNADVNAGQGPRTTADVPPLVVRIDENGFSQISTTSAVSGAGIGAFRTDAAGLGPDVFLIAPRGTVDAGDAGVRSSGNVFIAAFQVANADAIQAQGTISGAGLATAVNVSAQTNGDAAATAAAQAAQAAAAATGNQTQRPLIFVDVLGFLGDETEACDDARKLKGKC